MIGLKASHPSRHRRWLGGVAGLLTAALLLGSCGAEYDNMFPTQALPGPCYDSDVYGGFCKTDNQTLTYFFESSILAADEGVVTDRMNAEYGSTDLNPSYDSTPQYSGQAETDIIYQRGSLEGFIGYAWCEDADDGNQCDQHYVRFRSNVSMTGHLACHETGHAVGLTHGIHAHPSISNTTGSLGCMVTPADVSKTTLGANNRSQIDAT